MSALLAWFRALPRAGRWALLAALGIGAYFAILEPIVDLTASYRLKGDRLESLLARGELDPGSPEGRAVLLGIANFGEPLPPGPERERTEAFYTGVNEVLARHGVASPRLTTRERVPIATAGPVPGERLIVDVQFESTPEVVTAVLADLEREPSVAGVSRVLLRRSAQSADKAGGTLQVTLSPEAWIAAGTGGSR